MSTVDLNFELYFTGTFIDFIRTYIKVISYSLTYCKNT